VTGYELDNLKFGSQQRHKILGFWKSVPTGSGTPPHPSLLFNGYRGFYTRW